MTVSFLKNKNSGSIGMVLHESPSWDTLSSANVGAGNILALMGLAAPTSITDDYDSTAVYDRGDYVRLTVGSETTYWQSDVDSPIDFPAVASNEWRQVIQGVGRSLEEELGANSIVEVNGVKKFTARKLLSVIPNMGMKGFHSMSQMFPLGEA